MNCFVYQKHIDLHAVSALEAIHGFMNLGHCKGLTRFVHWESCNKLLELLEELRDLCNIY